MRELTIREQIEFWTEMSRAWTWCNNNGLSESIGAWGDVDAEDQIWLLEDKLEAAEREFEVNYDLTEEEALNLAWAIKTYEQIVAERENYKKSEMDDIPF
jgi:hypothetical protein